MSVTVVNAIAVHVGCLTGVREQQNQRSSFIDGTALYGFNRERELLLRVRSMVASWLIFLQKRAHLPLIKVLHSNVLLAMNIFDISLNMFFFYLDGGRLLESDRIQGLLPRSTCPAGISTPFHCFIAGEISLHSHYMPNTFLN